MKTAHTNLSAQLNAADDHARGQILEGIGEMEDRIQQEGMFHPGSRESMLNFLRTIEFYKHTDFGITENEKLMGWCYIEAAEILHRKASIQAHHNEEHQNDML